MEQWVVATPTLGLAIGEEHLFVIILIIVIISITMIVIIVIISIIMIVIISKEVAGSHSWI